MTTVQTAWLVFALLLMAGEMVIPEMFLLWLGFAALAVFATLLGVPDLPIVWQGVAFGAFSALSILVYLKFFRNRAMPIVDGRGRLKIGDAFWVAEGPDLPQGTRVRIVAVDGMSLQVRGVD